MKKYILFDLDGTITDSSEGITGCVSYALSTLGIKEDNQDVLRKYIGPPLDEGFANNHGLNKQDALKAVAAYRERYKDIGIYENILFDGIKEMLFGLREDGYVIALATCKPEIYVPRILEYFNIAHLFDIAVGSELEGGKRRHKDDVILEVLYQIIDKYKLNPDNAKKNSTEYDALLSDVKAYALMIGDRKDDILGAKSVGISSMGVRYGFAEPGELEACGADVIVDNITDIRQEIKKF